MLTPTERVECAYRGRWADKIPFTVDYNELFLCAEERELRNRGMCIVESRVPVVLRRNPGVSEKEIHYTGDDGIKRIKRVVQTERGSISEVYKVLPGHPRIPDELMPWHEEYFFKTAEDYAPIACMIRGRRYAPNYEVFEQMKEEAGGDVFLRPEVGYSPLQEIIYQIMGVEQWSMEWYERRDEVLKIYQVLADSHRRFYHLVARSPALTVIYGGNVAPEVVGPDRFERYIVPHYNEFAGILHEHGKLLTVHFDGNTRPIASAIAESSVDCIDSFTPYPEGDMSVLEARAAWPDKVLWVNFPTSLLLSDAGSIEESTRQILNEAGCGDRFVIGINESLPKDKLQTGLPAISRVLDAEGWLPLGNSGPRPTVCVG